MNKRRIIAVFVLLWIVFSNTIYAEDSETRYKYSLDVNIKQNIVTVYEIDENGEYTIPNRAFVCSVGDDTPTGTFKTSDKYVWRELFGNVYGQYATRITGHILFHSVPYNTMNKDDLEYEEYNKLGQTASAGCVRLCVKDVKWIYDNCPSGTTVNIIDSDSPEPLPKPAAYTIDVNDTQKRVWDPTDDDLKNPYLNDGIDYAPGPNVVYDSASMNINESMFYSKCYNVDGNNYFKISEIDKVFKMSGIPFSYNYYDLKSGNEKVLRVNTSDAPEDADLEQLGRNDTNFKNQILVLYGNKKVFADTYKIDGENYISIRDIAKFAQLDISWDNKNNCIELRNTLST